MQALIKCHRKILLADPATEVAKATGETLKLRNPKLNTFDNTFTRISGGASAPFPFKDPASYYTWVSSHNALQYIKVPFLAINSADDPVVKHVPKDCADNGLVVLGLTQRGGHLGWLQLPKSSDRWSTKPVIEWLKLVGQDLVWTTGSEGSYLEIHADGFIREHGNLRLGCRTIGGGDLIDGNAGEQDPFQNYKIPQLSVEASA